MEIPTKNKQFNQTSMHIQNEKQETAEEYACNSQDYSNTRKKVDYLDNFA